MTQPTPLPMGTVVAEFTNDNIEVVIDDFMVEVVPTERVVDILEVVVEGPQGPEGPKGATGNAGPAGGHYEYTRPQVTEAWVIQHDLGYNPAAVRVVDSEGNEHTPIVTYLTQNILQLTFAQPTAGTAWLS